MRKIRNIIILLILLIVVTIAILVTLPQLDDNEGNSGNVTGEENKNSQDEKEKLVRTVTDKDTFFNIKACVEEYYTVLESLWVDNSEALVFAEGISTEEVYISNYFAQRLYSILGEKYIEKNNITVDNIGNIFSQTNKKETVINDIYRYEITEDLTIYFVKGFNWNFKTSSKENINIIVAIQDSNFAIYPTEYIKDLQLEEVQEGDKLDIDESDFVVSRNEQNKYEQESIEVDTVIQEYINLYKFNINYNKEDAYASLNEEFRNRRFENIDEYKNYLKKNMSTIDIESYASYNTSNFIQYVCIAKDGRYFIINETAPMKYTIMLDPYTVDLQTFITEYNNSSDTTKVAMNIEKVKQAINDKDYRYVYNKLDETFKESNYPTIETFKDYITMNFFEKNAFSCENARNKNGTYIFQIKATSANDDSAEEKYINIIMRLDSGTDFTMSFGNN